MVEARLRNPLLLSILAALLTLGLKTGAYLLTGSVGLLSDAAESVVNLAAALVAYFSLRFASRPVDANHTYGHEKIEYFSSGLEGGLILVAALAIAYHAVSRLITPGPLQHLGPGLALSLVAALINGGVGLLLLRVGKKHNSIILEADGKHLLTDVWTSAGVLAALALIVVLGPAWDWLDPVIALVVSANILWTAFDLMRRSFNGLMDHALPEVEQALVRAAIEINLGPDMDYHALRTRQAGSHRFADFHLLVPGHYTVQQAHDLTGRVEDAVCAALPGLEVTVHIEPIEARESWQDSALLPVEQAAGRASQHVPPPERPAH
jgi:cation diffusion facilitator family transporter